jgi:hypothetical protein
MAAAFSASFANAQSRKAFAVTADTKGNYNWTIMREMALTSGETVKTIYTPTVSPSFAEYARLTAPQQQQFLQDRENMVAAAGYDQANNRLYFTPMFGNNLQYIDLATGAKHAAGTLKTFASRPGENDVITRMTFAADGNGYALTNDGEHLIRFTAGGQSTVTDLGSLVDGANNKGVSVHTQCTSWGGDIVGDAYGNLYLFTFRNHVFKINIATRVADYVGSIKNIPAEFTANGAAAMENGYVILSSSTQTAGYYKVNMATLEATLAGDAGASVYNASDLASSTLLFEEALVKKAAAGTETASAKITVYPNPVTGKTFNVSLNNFSGDKFNIVVTNASGANIAAKVSGNTKSATNTVVLPATAKAGLYVVKVLDDKSNVIHTEKLIVQ